MPSPKSKEDLQKLFGLMTYMGVFIPRLSAQSHVLRDLLKKETPFIWESNHQEAFEKMKLCISEDSLIAYYDVTKPVTLEVDASMKGLGACLVQDGRPIIFASKTLTQAQSNYSNIEREMLGVMYGVERFHTYLYGRRFTIVTDHQPLENICGKPITAAPPRLQRMLLRIQGYDYTVVYRPAEQLTVPDVLSRLPNPRRSETVELDIRVDDLDLDFIHFNQRKQLKQETQRNPVLSALSEVIFNGWPDKITELPRDVRPFWAFRESLGIEDGVIFKGKRVLVPDSMRSDILEQLHAAHQGIEKTRLLARETVYWPKINEDIDQVTRQCEMCREYQPPNRREPLIPLEVPSKPWQILGTDIFEVNQIYYIIISDLFSKFPVIRKSRIPVTAAAIVNFFEEKCAMFGIPDEIRSDNGPQYTAHSFQMFCQQWGIVHTTSSPHFAQSNGFIENQIKYIKKSIIKCGENNRTFTGHF
jgi:hypothetical protein